MHDGEIIEQFRAAMADKEIRIAAADIKADGKFHRVHSEDDRKGSRNAWYVLHLDEKPAGAFGCNKRYGNKHKFTWTSKSTKPLTADERREYREKMDRQRAERAAIERELREDAANRAAQIWAAAAECDSHPYLTRKGVKSYGLRVGHWERVDAETGEIRLVSKSALLVPIRDAKKSIHSLTAIFPAKIGGRDKDFLKNGAKAGLFYSFGKPVLALVGGVKRLVIVIGEGYATLASIHHCTGHACIVALDAGNLVPVAKVIRARFPEACIVIAADNDQWTLQPVLNPGLTSAREAAKAVGGLVALPSFAKDAADKPTDFNDLHRLEGEDAVRQALQDAINPPAPLHKAELLPWEGESEIQPAMPGDDGGGDDDDDEDARPEKNGFFAILGYDHERYFIFQHGKRQIADITKGDMSEKGLIELAPLNWWEMNFPGNKNASIDTSAAANFIIRTAEKRGIYDISRIRGRGAWNDAGRMVYHHGGHLSVDGVATDITQISSRYVYELDRALPEPADTALTNEEGQRLLGLAEAFRWTKPGSAALLAGWVALAPICGALRWRPHIWLTGGPGCGKTTILNEYAHHLLGGLDVFAQGNSSEAGIRQTLRADARPVLFDETEQNDDREKARVQSVIALIRQSSTESEAQTLKGTAGGDAMAFHIRSMFCLSSIQVGMKHQADVERLAVLALKPKREDTDAAGSWERLKELLYSVKRDDTIPPRLFRRALDLLPITLKNISVFTHAAATVFNSQRDGDQYGTMLAGAWSLISTELATKEQALELIKRYDWSEHRENNEMDEGERAMSALMSSHIRINGGIEVTVYELVCCAFGEPTDINQLDRHKANALLQRYGMKVKDDRLLLSNNSNELRRLMADTGFDADHRGVLLRVQGADRNDNKPTKFNGVQSKCISLPLGPIVSDERPATFTSSDTAYSFGDEPPF